MHSLEDMVGTIDRSKVDFNADATRRWASHSLWPNGTSRSRVPCMMSTGGAQLVAARAGSAAAQSSGASGTGAPIRRDSGESGGVVRWPAIGGSLLVHLQEIGRTVPIDHC